MTNAVLFDFNRRSLLPFAFTRPTSEIRVGIWTIKEHWEALLEQPVSYLTEDYLNGKFPVWKESENLFLNGNIIPDTSLITAARDLSLGQRLVKNGVPLAAFAEGWPDPMYPYGRFRDIEFNGEIHVIRNLWDIFTQCGSHIQSQFNIITKDRKSQPLSNTNRVIGNGKVFIEEGAKVECSIFNTESGPIYIGKNAEVMEGSLIRGPFALGENAVLKMGAKIYGATTIGPGCKVGGEVSNSVFIANSNKAHDGFLGNSVIGEWCNLGADTNTSNLKNNYSNVKVWSYHERKMIDTGLLFCRLMMGDHSKCGINTMFNTGTVVGVSANIFGAGFPDKFLPSFTWGGTAESEKFLLDKAVALAGAVMKRRGISMTPTDEKILSEVFLNELNPISE